jgi:DNA-binding CsgD family transcriptional regulator
MQGAIAADLGHRPEALGLLSDALTYGYKQNMPLQVGDGLTAIADVAQRDRRPALAARLLGAAETLREEAGATVRSIDRPDYERVVNAVRASLDAAALAEQWSSGRALTMDRAVAEALAYATGGETLQPDRATARQIGEQEGLSPRELTVLRLVVAGRTDQEIADILSISRRTVSAHMTNILGKLSLSNRVEAATYAVRHDLV